MLRSFVDGMTLLSGRCKRHQRVNLAKAAQPVKVNIGCGLAVAPGWINVDGSFNALVATWPRPLHRLVYRFSGTRRYYSEAEFCRLLGDHRFIHHDLSYGLPFADGTLDFVYSSHFIEHLFRKDARFLFKEMYRALKPGGMIRISIPDLAYAISLYQSGRKEKMLSSYFFVEDDDSYYARHKYMYDFDMLTAVLKEVGFQDLQHRQFQEGAFPDLTVLDVYPEDSLFVEGKK
jgi:predicted SAM-dependent methyltransferase